MSVSVPTSQQLMHAQTLPEKYFIWAGSHGSRLTEGRVAHTIEDRRDGLDQVPHEPRGSPPTNQSKSEHTMSKQIGMKVSMVVDRPLICG